MNRLQQLAVFFTILVSSSIVIAPVGLRNSKNSCYINAVLQVLYHTPPIREEVTRTLDQSTSLNKGLKSLFCRLDQANSAKSERQSWISAKPDFLRALWQCLEEDKAAPKIVAGKEGDAHELLLFLSKKNEMKFLRDSFEITIEQRVFSVQDEEPNNQELKVLSNTTVKNFGHILTIAGHEPSQRSVQAMLADQQEEVDFEKSPALKVSKISAAGPILLFQLMRMTKGNARDDSLLVQIDPIIVLLGQQYWLYAMVLARPGHVTAAIESISDPKTWFHYDDDKVTAIDLSAVLAQELDAYLLFYVEQEYKTLHWPVAQQIAEVKENSRSDETKKASASSGSSSCSSSSSSCSSSEASTSSDSKERERKRKKKATKLRKNKH